MTTPTSEPIGGKWAQPNGPSELDCPWCTRNCFPPNDADDADCTCQQWCGTPDCTQEGPDPDTAALAGAYEAAEAELDELRELLGSIWLYVDWLYVTKKLTTGQKDLWADAVDATSMAAQAADGYEPRPVAVRWWDDDFVEDGDE